jgi:hypothetical protein
MSKFVRLAAAVGSTALVVLALLVPSALAAGGNSASPSAAAAWPACGGGTNTHCVTKACHGNEVWDYYWNKYPTNLDHIAVDPFLQCA